MTPIQKKICNKTRLNGIFGCIFAHYALSFYKDCSLEEIRENLDYLVEQGFLYPVPTWTVGESGFLSRNPYQYVYISQPFRFMFKYLHK